VAARCGSPRFQNGSRGGKDAGRVVVGDFLFGFEPVLDVASAELRSVEAQRFAADERDGFRLHLAQMAGSEFVVHEFFAGGVPENNVGDSVERGFVWERGKRIDGNLALPRKPLNVTVDFVKRRACNVQSLERRLQVEAGNRRNVGFLAFGLCEHKPVRPKPEGVACLLLCWFFLRAVRVRGSLEWHGHAKGDSGLSLADVPFAFEPTAISVERSGLQVASNALFEGKQGIPEGVVVKCGVGSEHSPGLFDRLVQEFSPSGMLFFWHFCFSSFLPFSSVVFA
jgi:hypothetical protein